MPTPQQQDYRFRQQAVGDRPRNNGPWFWQGFARPGVGRIRNAAGILIEAPTTGNASTPIGSEVLYVPGRPVGQIRLKEVPVTAEFFRPTSKTQYFLEVVHFFIVNVFATTNSGSATFTSTLSPDIAVESKEIGTTASGSFQPGVPPGITVNVNESFNFNVSYIRPGDSIDRQIIQRTTFARDRASKITLNYTVELQANAFGLNSPFTAVFTEILLAKKIGEQITERRRSIRHFIPAPEGGFGDASGIFTDTLSFP
ncbi:MAG: hypothetical protein AAF773_00765 [Cyanobacteria bacterium P01_D01_bin.115]